MDSRPVPGGWVTAVNQQGEKDQGMGVDLYHFSPAARAVWDSADAHLISAYGFSIMEIVQENPKKKGTF